MQLLPYTKSFNQQLIFGSLLSVSIFSAGCGNNDDSFAVTPKAKLISLANPEKSISLVENKPNIVLILVDDLGYGELGSYNSKQNIPTPNLDTLAEEGVRFTDAYATAATCTASRFSLLTGTYAWRQAGTNVASGEASAIIQPHTTTLPSLLKKAGYTTGIVGKWHLGLGTKEEGPQWNGFLSPGPLEVGFDYAYIMPSTNDRVPTVYVENHQVANLDANDPITISYKSRLRGDTLDYQDYIEQGKTNQLRQLPSDSGHKGTVINGVPRIGYMTGGNSARWSDDTMTDNFLQKSNDFIQNNKSKPFFLGFSSQDVHVPRLVDERFAGKSGYGARGDSLLRLDWTVGQIKQILADHKVLDNTIIIFTSDNGSVLDDGYTDQAVSFYGGKNPTGPLRGGKYSQFEAGTRIPLIISWPKGGIPQGKVSHAIVSQVDFVASIAAATKQTLPVGSLTSGVPQDSINLWDAFTGIKNTGRSSVVLDAQGLAIRQNNWKLIPPSSNKRSFVAGVETGYSNQNKLYNLDEDPGEQTNLAEKNELRLKELDNLLSTIQENTSDYRKKPL
ncbi:sulfatase-like hydrolase/transferase [Acinetobacter sp. WZC-1]|uniref:sulfatase-like hydrolase/transferase n=1 Tax=Acinetobacter sp. WZC-1 TaxID=3459034 RepID=UPI00403E0BFC